jgi:hypothetical protein
VNSLAKQHFQRINCIIETYGFDTTRHEAANGPRIQAYHFLKALTIYIAFSIRLEPDLQASLFKKPDRAISRYLTELAVADSFSRWFVRECLEAATRPPSVSPTTTPSSS